MGERHQKRKRWEKQVGRRKHMLAQSGGKCAICGEQVCLREGDPRYATIDHIVPTSRGGLDKPSNWQIACLACNRAKGDKMPAEAAE